MDMRTKYEERRRQLNAMKKTNHLYKRAQQRGLRVDDPDVVIRWGRQIWANGARISSVGRRDIDEALRRIPMIMADPATTPEERVTLYADMERIQQLEGVTIPVEIHLTGFDIMKTIYRNKSAITKLRKKSGKKVRSKARAESPRR
jgi:hypothetical protein